MIGVLVYRQALILFAFFLTQRGDCAAGIWANDDILRFKLIKRSKFKGFSFADRKVDKLNSLRKASAAACTQNGATVKDIHNVFSVQNFHKCSSLRCAATWQL